MDRAKTFISSIIIMVLFALVLSENLFSQSGCDLSGFRTFTQGGWGNPSNSTPGGIRDAHFTAVFPSGATIGGNYTAKFTSAAAIMNYLPAGGQGQAFTQNYNNASSTSAGVFGGQLLAAFLNVKYDSLGFLGTNSQKLGNLLITSGTFSGKSVNELLYYANIAIGGGSTPYTIAQLNTALTSFNENFDNGTVDNGYLTCGATPKASLGDKVWIDTNKDGIQDASEVGFANVTVKLYSCSDVLISTTTTNASGVYGFSNLTPGSYYVQFVAPAGFTFSPKDAGSDDSKDSDADVTTGKTSCFTLTAGQNDITRDAGVFVTPIVLASLGDKVWLDTNKDGIQDAGEVGLANVTVKLYDCSDVLISTTTTNASGLYGFSNLTPGSYYVQFVAPSGYTISPKDAGSDDSKDSDADVTTGKTTCFTLTAGQLDITHDAGMFVTPALPISIGDKVWIDTNKDGIQDASEAGLANVTVKLYDCSNVLISTTSTDASGLYHFSNIPAGSYYVQFVTPSGYSVSPKDAGSDDAKDSDADVSTGKTTCKTYLAGTTDNSIDAGMFSNPVTSATDLQITKTVNNQTLTCGQTLSYTITIKNNGPLNAGSIVVLDSLPVGLVFVSSTASQGAYSAATSKWTVGTLNNGASATLTISTTVDCNAMNSSTIDLGPAKSFNVFVIEDLTQPSADTQGKLAVGRNATLGNYSVADQLPNSNGSVDVLVVGKTLTYTSGAVYSGNVVYGDSTNLPISQVSIANGTLRKESVIDFAAAKTYLENLSTQLGGYTVNGTTTLEWSTLNLTHNDPFLNVFLVNAADLNVATSVQINVPNGSAVVVNIMGTNIEWHGGLTVNGTSMNNVIYNFPQATTVKISNIDIHGSLLAPYATLNFPSGIITGQTMVKSMFGSGQFNLSPFLGNIPLNRSIVNTASILCSDILDSDASNNHSSATSSFSADTSNSGSGNNTGWQLIGNLPVGETVSCLESDNLGNSYAGMSNGYIYKTTNNGQTWNHVNSTMYSGIIWAMKVHPNGSIFAATVTGIYVSTNNGTTWSATSLQYKDVRSLKTDAQGNLYAGTWGFGMFVSTNAGSSWSQSNSGLGSHMIITSITVTPNQNVFAGTFDGGVALSLDHGNNWSLLNIGYNYIWALASNASGDLFAGTYGDGLYRSTNNGISWSKTSFPSAHVYELRIDASNNIYAAAYSGGVYMSSNNGSTWTNIGMGGMSLSSIMIVPNSQVVFSGTSNGKIYMKSANVTSVATTKNGTIVNYALQQNYPNPFNPSTMIKYDVPFESNVIIKVYDVTGRLVSTLFEGINQAGSFVASFNASNLASGIYIYTMNAVAIDGNSKFNTNKKMLLVK